MEQLPVNCLLYQADQANRLQGSSPSPIKDMPIMDKPQALAIADTDNLTRWNSKQSRPTIQSALVTRTPERQALMANDPVHSSRSDRVRDHLPEQRESAVSPLSTTLVVHPHAEVAVIQPAGAKQVIKQRLLPRHDRLFHPLHHAGEATVELLCIRQPDLE